MVSEMSSSDVRFEVFKAVTMKNAVFWDVAPCRSCVNRRFGGTYRLHLQGRIIRERETSVSRWLQSPYPRRRHSTCLVQVPIWLYGNSRNLNHLTTSLLLECYKTSLNSHKKIQETFLRLEPLFPRAPVLALIDLPEIVLGEIIIIHNSATPCLIYSLRKNYVNHMHIYLIHNKDITEGSLRNIHVTHSLMELGPSWEAATCATTQELPSIL
jgi:hypothetical protein